MASATERRILDASRHIAGPDKVPGSAADLRSGDILVPNETPVIWRAPMVMGALQQMLSDVAWGELHRLPPPGTGNAQLTMAQQVPLAPTKASTCSIQEDRDTGVRHRRGHEPFPVPAIARTQRDFQPSWCPTKSRAARHELHGDVLLDLRPARLRRSKLDHRVRARQSAGARFPPYSEPHLRKRVPTLSSARCALSFIKRALNGLNPNSRSRGRQAGNRR